MSANGVINSVRPGCNFNSEYISYNNNLTSNSVKFIGIKMGLVVWTTSALQMAWQQANIRSDVGQGVGPQKCCVTKMMKWWMTIHHLIYFIMQELFEMISNSEKFHLYKSILINLIN